MLRRAALALLVASPVLSCRVGYDEFLQLGSAGGLNGSGATAEGASGPGLGGAHTTGASASGGSSASGGAGDDAAIGEGGSGDATAAMGGSPGDPGAGGAATGSGGAPSGGGPSGCRLEVFGGHDYAACDAAKSYVDAAASCATTGMYPVRIDDQAENDWVHSLIPAADQANNSTLLWRWIGATDPGNTGDWSWSDGEQFWTGGQNGMAVGGAYDNWVGGRPLGNRGCAAMEARDGTWYAMQCTGVRPYICERY